MGNKHINQANQNERSHDEMCASHPEGLYDWKITVLFYQAFHSIKALAMLKNIDIGDTHNGILKNIRPGMGIMPVRKDVHVAYTELMSFSWDARYGGFTNADDFKALSKFNHGKALLNCAYIKRYVGARGVDFG